MKKFTCGFRFPINVQSNSQIAIELRNATPETHPHRFGETKICVIENTIYWKQPKHNIGVINLRSKGGKWVKCPLNAPEGERCESVTNKILKQIGAVAADFRGSPRIK